MSRTDNDPCRGSKRVIPDWKKYYPAKGGHVVEASLYDVELDEIDAGTQCVAAVCEQCGKWVRIMLANDIEYTGDTTPYFPSSRERWRYLNNLN